MSTIHITTTFFIFLCAKISKPNDKINKMEKIQPMEGEIENLSMEQQHCRFMYIRVRGVNNINKSYKDYFGSQFHIALPSKCLPVTSVLGDIHKGLCFSSIFRYPLLLSTLFLHHITFETH